VVTDCSVAISSLLPPQAVNPSALINAISSTDGPDPVPECTGFFRLGNIAEGRVNSE
jgi:hypothetical protein